MLFVQSTRENKAVNMHYVVYTETRKNPDSRKDACNQFVLIAHMVNGSVIPIAYGDDVRVLEDRLQNLAKVVTVPCGSLINGEVCDEVPF